MPKIQILSPASIAGTFELTQNLITFGRSSQNALCINDSNVSSYHGILVRNGDTYQLHDFNSTNGTFVNGERILAIKLPPQADIRLGPVELRYEAAPAPPAAKPLGIKVSEPLKRAEAKDGGMAKRMKPDFAKGQLDSGPVTYQPGSIGSGAKPIPAPAEKK